MVLGVAAVHVQDFISVYVGGTFNDPCHHFTNNCYTAMKFISLTQTLRVHLVSYLNKNFTCCERKGQQHGAEPDAPRCSTDNLRVRTKQSLSYEHVGAEISA